MNDSVEKRDKTNEFCKKIDVASAITSTKSPHRNVIMKEIAFFFSMSGVDLIIVPILAVRPDNELVI